MIRKVNALKVRQNLGQLLEERQVEAPGSATPRPPPLAHLHLTSAGGDGYPHWKRST